MYNYFKSSEIHYMYFLGNSATELLNSKVGDMTSMFSHLWEPDEQIFG